MKTFYKRFEPLKPEIKFDLSCLPTGVKLIDPKDLITGAGANAVAKRFLDDSLHSLDLEYSRECLDLLMRGANKDKIIIKALWEASIGHLIKCFETNNSRNYNLHYHDVYKTKELRKKYLYFKNLRDKHIAHDENSISQAIIGVGINDGSKPYKVEKDCVICLSANALIISETDMKNLREIITKASLYVTQRADDAAVQITKIIESLPYDLVKKQKIAPSLKAPQKKHISEKRKTQF